jgi:hypothetical protein
LIDVNLFATPWFLTLFSYNGDHSFIFRVWDIFFFEKYSIIFKISVNILLQSKGMTNSHLIIFTIIFTIIFAIASDNQVFQK